MTKYTLEDIANFKEHQLENYYKEYLSFSKSGITPSNALIRLLTIDIFGEDNIMQIQFVGLKILEEIARRYYGE